MFSAALLLLTPAPLAAPRPAPAPTPVRAVAVARARIIRAAVVRGGAAAATGGVQIHRAPRRDGAQVADFY